MRFDLRVLSVVVLATLSSRCTIYTCPANNTCGTPNTNNMGGAPGTSGATGSSGAGGGIASGGNPSGDWVNVTANLAGMDTMCGNTGLIVSKPDEDKLIAAVALHGLWSSVDGGQSWQQISASKKLTNSASALVFDPADSTQYWVVGNHASPYLMTTSDDGDSFSAPGEGDFQGLDYISLDFTDPKRNLLLVGWHESPQSVSLSTDGGDTWKAVGAKLPANVFCGTPLVIDAKTFLVGCVDGEILRSTDAGSKWSQVSDKGGDRAPLQASDGSIYWSCTDGGLIRSTDGGATWSDILAAGTLIGIPPIELPDQRVAVVTMSGVIAGTADGDWTRVTSALTNDPFTITYSKQQKAFFYAHGDCGTVVPDQAILSYSYDYAQ